MAQKKKKRGEKTGWKGGSGTAEAKEKKSFAGE